MIRCMLLLVAILAFCSSVSAQYKSPELISVKPDEKIINQWNVEWSEKASDSDAKLAIKLMRELSVGFIIGKTDYKLSGKTATIQIQVKGGARSGAMPQSIIRTAAAKKAADYQVTMSYNSPLMDKDDIGKTIAIFDATLRGHKEGANEGIQLVPNVKKTESTIWVVLSYAGGPYGK